MRTACLPSCARLTALHPHTSVIACVQAAADSRATHPGDTALSPTGKSCASPLERGRGPQNCGAHQSTQGDTTPARHKTSAPAPVGPAATFRSHRLPLLCHAQTTAQHVRTRRRTLKTVLCQRPACNREGCLCLPPLGGDTWKGSLAQPVAPWTPVSAHPTNTQRVTLQRALGVHSTTQNCLPSHSDKGTETRALHTPWCTVW